MVKKLLILPLLLLMAGLLALPVSGMSPPLSVDYPNPFNASFDNVSLMAHNLSPPADVTSYSDSFVSMQRGAPEVDKLTAMTVTSNSPMTVPCQVARVDEFMTANYPTERNRVSVAAFTVMNNQVATGLEQADDLDGRQTADVQTFKEDTAILARIVDIGDPICMNDISDPVWSMTLAFNYTSPREWREASKPAGFDILKCPLIMSLTDAKGAYPEGGECGSLTGISDLTNGGGLQYPTTGDNSGPYAVLVWGGRSDQAVARESAMDVWIAFSGSFDGMITPRSMGDDYPGPFALYGVYNVIGREIFG